MKNKTGFQPLIYEWFSHRNWESFSLGLNFASELGSMLADGATYEMLNYMDSVPSIDYREYYMVINLGYGSLTLGFRIKKANQTIVTKIL